MRRSLFPVLFILAMTTTTAFAIFEGVASEDEKVLALGRWGAGGAIVNASVEIGLDVNGDGNLNGNDTVDLDLIGTGNVIAYKGIDQRCVLTAKHVKPCKKGKTPPCVGANARWHRAVLEQDVRTLVDAHRDQLVARTGAVMPGTPNFDTYRDLRINWLENKASDGDDIRIALGDYDAKPIDQAPLANLPNQQAQPAGIRYEIVGYGDNASPTVGRGVRRWGKPKLLRLDVRGVGNKGARVRTTFVASEPYSECYGDSGAAIDVNDKAFSAVSAGSNNNCNPALRADYWDPNPAAGIPDDTGVPRPAGFPGAVRLDGGTVLHSILNSDTTASIATPPANTDWKNVGNWEQIKYQISNVCTKQVDTRISGEGKIVGSLSSPLATYGEDRLDHDVFCEGFGGLLEGYGDCVEAVHQPETLTLQAIPAADWEFDEWALPVEVAPDDGPPVDVDDCPCGSNPVCVIHFDDIGTYTADVSDDYALCVAIFKPVQPTGGTCTMEPCPIALP
ncbi:MAG: hypothetical protein AAF560_20710 [Acidobacteriota bacterium]